MMGVSDVVFMAFPASLHPLHLSLVTYLSSPTIPFFSPHGTVLSAIGAALYMTFYTKHSYL